MADLSGTNIHENFTTGLAPLWRVTQIGGGVVKAEGGLLHLMLPTTTADRYSDAQISSYSGRSFTHRPPLRMIVRAWAAHPPEQPDHSRAGGVLTANWVGTAGFGFWNQPFMPGQRGFALPQALWFFFSAAPNNMALARGVAGQGWKAATFNARRWQFLALLPAAPLGVLLMRIPACYERLWHIGQRAIGVSEAALDPALLDAPHTYTLDWLADRVVFAVDGIVIHTAQVRIADSLGFVLWIDNQYAVVTPQGQFGFGVSPVAQPQTLVVESVTIAPLPNR